MKRIFALMIVLVFIPCCTLAEVTAEDVASVLKQAFSEWDYCDVRYDESGDSLFIDLAMDGFAQNLYSAIDNDLDSASEEWNQFKGMFLAIYYSVESFFEIAEIETPEYIMLQLWNDDVVIRNDHTTGKSRILLAIQNEMFYIDEVEVYSETEQPTRAIPTKETTSAYILNTNSKRFHIPSCDSVGRMKEKNRKDYSGTREELISFGYAPCGSCNP